MKIYVLIIQAKVEDQDYILHIPQLSPDDSIEIMNNELKLCNRMVTLDQFHKLENAIVSCPEPLFVKLLSSLACQWKGAYTVPNNILRSNIKDQLETMFEKYERKYGKKYAMFVFGLLSVCRDGLSDFEICHITASHNQLTAMPFCARNSNSAPPIAWYSMRRDLEEYLHKGHNGDLTLWSWKHPVFRDVIVKKLGQDVESVRNKIIGYFEPQEIQVGTFYNKRKLLEYPYQLGELKHISKLKICLADPKWISAIIGGLGVYILCENVRVYLSLAQEDQEIYQLQRILTQSLHTLESNRTEALKEIEKQIKTVPSELREKGIFHKVNNSCSLDNSLVVNPSEFDMELLKDVSPRPILNGLFRVKSDNNHVISISEEKGEIKVWNIHTREAVRTLNGIAQPRNIKMADEHCAIVLCNRELKCYNIERGTLESKLKGVLNLKHPYFDIHSSELVVSLSRNRMYVHIISRSTGDVRATFKVGEDRFLDSLLVSGNGQICVCGDEVQKPFPLLVWNLADSKLIHDLRIDGHEFLTDKAAITNDGQYGVCVCKVRI